MAGILLTGTEHHGRPVGIVRGVRIVLALEADAGALVVDDAMLASDGAVEEVAGVDLDAGLVSVDVEADAGLGAGEGDCRDCDVAVGVEDPVVVVTVAELDLLEIALVNVVTYPSRLKYEWLVMLMTVGLSVVAS